ARLAPQHPLRAGVQRCVRRELEHEQLGVVCGIGRAGQVEQRGDAWGRGAGRLEHHGECAEEFHRLLPGAFVPRVRRSGARGQADGGCPGRADALSCRRNATTRRTRGDDAEMRHFRMLPACLALAACAGGAGMQPTDAAPRAALVEPAPIEAGQAPPPGPYAPGFDAVHYGIALTLPDTGSYIRGVT